VRIVRGRGLVLVVDDEEWVRKTTRRMLERLGFDVIEAIDGEDALMRAASHHGEVRAVLLDITMPRLDGPQTLRELRHRSPQLPVVMMSGFAEADLNNRGLELANGFLQKPFKVGTLRTTIRELLDSD
jgi:CheY-like chemotaxis protein